MNPRWLLRLNFDIDKYINPIIPSSPLKRLPKPISRFFGYREMPEQPLGNVVSWLWSFIGAFSGIALIAGVFKTSALIQGIHAPLIIGSFVSLLSGFSLADSLLNLTGRCGNTRIQLDRVTLCSTEKPCSWPLFLRSYRRQHHKALPLAPSRTLRRSKMARRVSRSGSGVRGDGADQDRTSAGWGHCSPGRH